MATKFEILSIYKRPLLLLPIVQDYMVHLWIRWIALDFSIAEMELQIGNTKQLNSEISR